LTGTIVLLIIAGACDEPSSTSTTPTSVIATAAATDPPAETVAPVTTSERPFIPHDVGNAATPAAGGTLVGEWTGTQLQTLGVFTDEVRVGVLSDYTLAGLTNDGSQILIVGPDGDVVESVHLPGSYDQMLVHAGDRAELFVDSVESTWVSLSPGQRGVAMEPLRRPAVEGAGCFWVVGFENERQLVTTNGSKFRPSTLAWMSRFAKSYSADMRLTVLRAGSSTSRRPPGVWCSITTPTTSSCCTPTRIRQPDR